MPLLREAQRQGLVARLARDSPFLEGMAEGARAEWRAAATQLLVRGTWQLDLTRRVVGLLKDAGLRALPLKGAALAEGLYGSPAERPMADVDLLVLDAPEQAIVLLVERGFVLAERAEHAAALREPGSGAVVELHRGFTSCPALFPVDAEGLWARRRRRDGLVEVVPSAADLLVSASLHAAFQHGFGLSLVQFLDFRLLLERDRPETAAVLEAASSARAEGAVLLSLQAAKQVVGAAPDSDLVAALERRATPGVVRRARDLVERDPLSLVAPEGPSLAELRLGLLEGRRVDLLRQTLRPAPWPGEAAGASAPVEAFRRAFRILSRELLRPRTPEKAQA